jgi:amidase
MPAFDHYSGLVEVSELIRRREASPVEVTQAMLARIARLDGALKSYVTVTAGRALDQARRAESEVARGFWRGPLHGVPLALKDLCNTDYAPTSAGMTIYRHYVPPRNATVVDRLEAAGAVILGKLAMTEGAHALHHPGMPCPTNPWHADYWMGISSSGSGVATAAGLCFGATGSDTGGSIRLPSAACGLTGLKTTWGRVSRDGIFPLSPSLDTVGPMARRAEDAAAMLAAMAGHDPRDPSSIATEVPDYLGGIAAGVRGLRLGVDEAVMAALHSDVARVLEQAAAVLARAGMRRVSVQLPDLERVLSIGFYYSAVETLWSHRDTWPSREADYSPYLAERMREAASITPLQLIEAQQERRAFSGRLAALFRDMDLLLMPVLPDPLARMTEYRGLGRLIRFTAPFNASGSPTITLPGGVDSAGLPVGFQLVGPHLSEDLLLRAGHAFQRITDWHTRHPQEPLP